MKTCPKCGEQKGSHEFHKASNTKNGRHTICKKCRTAYNTAIIARYRLDVMEKLGDRCQSRECGWVNADGSFGCMDPQALQIDHIRGGGHQEYGGYKCGKRVKGASIGAYYKKLTKLTIEQLAEKYQLLCANCNWIKRYTDSVKKKLDIG